ncbi:hypothetical protein [Nostoc sp. FACHB-888]|uniref:hypothetical protein n=1 Tax=Nostoc sp. FACHB-888 TaxID=2692842 RepID=UPI001682684B|nr:hypothetical protein [Nostoc sp. FACHB-888]MBD2249102.1 hypothetical protein [Nostoc sp. FACHB-888]
MIELLVVKAFIYGATFSLNCNKQKMQAQWLLELSLPLGFWNYTLHASSDAEGGKLRVARMC